MRKEMLAMLAAATLVTGVAGCKGGEKEKRLDPLDKEEKVSMKVMFWDNSLFYRQYGNFFATEFPNVDIEVLDMQQLYSDPNVTADEGLDKFIEANKPDVLLLSEAQYAKYAKDGKLLELDPIIEKDDFSMDGIHPAMPSLLRELGDGKLYGLSPEIESAGLFYNSELFEKYGIETPRDSMSWDEVFELAKRFPVDGESDKRVYGLSLGSEMTVGNFIRTVGQAQGLQSVNADGSQVSFDTASWKKVAESVIDLIRSGAYHVPVEDEEGNFLMEDIYRRDVFLLGGAAMRFGKNRTVMKLRQAAEDLKWEPIEWGVVTAPVDPNNRNQNRYFELGVQIYAISTESSNVRAAWEFIKYINGEKYAQLNHRSVFGGLKTWTDYEEEQDGRSMEPFLKLDPAMNAGSEQLKAPPRFLDRFSEIITSEVDTVLSGEQTLDEAMRKIQEIGQEELKENNASD